MHQLLMQEQRSRGLAVLMITHDVTEAVTLADRVLVMAANPGHFVWQMALPVPPMLRDDAWVHNHTAALLAQPVVRAAFDLPLLRTAQPAETSGSTCTAAPGQTAAIGTAAGHAAAAAGVAGVADTGLPDYNRIDAGSAVAPATTGRRTGC